MKSILKLIVLLSAACFVGCATPKPSIELGPDARVNSEGLHFVNNTVLDEAWFQPSINMANYTKILIVNAGVHFNEGSGKMSRKADVEKQRARFEDIVTEEFQSELSNLKNFEIVQEAGPGVLLLHGAITNIELVESADLTGRNRTYARDLGSANLIIDLRDSVTGEAIILAQDKRAIEGMGTNLSLVTDHATWAAVRTLSKSWATLLRERLDLLASYQLGTP
jgi:hypothetical protein